MAKLAVRCNHLKKYHLGAHVYSDGSHGLPHYWCANCGSYGYEYEDGRSGQPKRGVSWQAPARAGKKGRAK